MSWPSERKRSLRGYPNNTMVGAISYGPPAIKNGSRKHSGYQRKRFPTYSPLLEKN